MKTPITPDSLYDLLPSIHRLRDERGALRELCGILAREARIVEDDVFRLAESGFVETCPDWLVPYLGDLLGVTGLGTYPGSVLSGRAEVADVLAWRRRKGTAAVLERIALAVTGWPGKAVEFFQTLAVTQHLAHTRPHGRWTADVRSGDRMELVDGPFDPTPHTVDVRRIEPRRGRHGIPHVGLFLWRLEAHPIELAEARASDEGEGLYTISPLGLDLPLFAPGDAWDVDTRVATRHVPDPITRRELHANPEGHVGQSFTLYEGTPGNWNPIPEDEIVACDLSAWPRPIPQNRIGVDPVLGRIAFGEDAEPETWRISYHYGFAGDLGGGAYPRGEESLETVDVLTVGDGAEADHGDLASALAAWGGSGSVVIEVQDSRTYEETLGPLAVASGQRLEIRAASEQRPVLILDGELTVTGAEDSTFVLDGLLVTGGDLRLGGEMDRIRISHTTLHPDAVSLFLDSGEAEVEIERSILGVVEAADECRATVVDSILDAGSPDERVWTGGSLRFVRSTAIGGVDVRELPLAESAIFLGPVVAERRQQGCVRFSHVPRGSRVPRRYRCQPVIPDDATPREAARIAARVFPRFTSLTFGEPGYGQLAGRRPEEIFRGAEDGSEMGAFSHLQQPQRLDRVETRLTEYLPLGLEAGVFFVT